MVIICAMGFLARKVVRWHARLTVAQQKHVISVKRAQTRAKKKKGTQ